MKRRTVVVDFNQRPRICWIVSRGQRQQPLGSAGAASFYLYGRSAPCRPGRGAVSCGAGPRCKLGNLPVMARRRRLAAAPRVRAFCREACGKKCSLLSSSVIPGESLFKVSGGEGGASRCSPDIDRLRKQGDGHTGSQRRALVHSRCTRCQ